MQRDWSVPYTEQELEGLKAHFRGLPTYKPGGWARAADIPNMVEFMGYPRTHQQIEGYVAYWEKHSGGIVTLEDFVKSASVVHSTSEFARDYALKMDANGDGTISKDEFQVLIKLMSTHDPKLSGTSYEKFLSEADTDHDGRVSIDECAKWIEVQCRTS